MEIQESTNKNLNLVFENYNQSEPIPNFHEVIGDLEFNRPDGFFHFYERYYHEQMGFDINFLDIKYWKISDVSLYPNKNFYFSVKTEYSLKEIICDKGLKISNEVTTTIKENKNLYVMFIQEHESEFEEDLVALQNYIDSNSLPSNQFIVLTNNYNLKNIVEKNNIRYQLIKLNLLQLTSTSVFSEVTSQYNQNKKGKFFLCFNKYPKKHRYSLLVALDYYNILEDTNWSLIGKPREYESHHFKPLFNEEFLEKLNFEKFKDFELKESDYEIGKNHFNTDLSSNIREKLPRGGGASGGLMLPEYDYIYRESYFNIVTETLFEDMWNSIHITEKSYRPFYFMMFPIFVSTYHHVKQLRDIYNFDLFDDIIDHSYDNEPDKFKRFRMVIDEIHRINNRKQFFIEFYNNNQERFEKNKEKMHEVGYNCKSLDIDIFWNLCD